MPKKTVAKQKKKIREPQIKPEVSKGQTNKKSSSPKTATATRIKMRDEPKKASVNKLTHREKKFQDIKKKLLAQKKSLLMGAMEALNELPGPTVFPDMGDQATAEMDRNFMLRLRGRERKLLKKIDEAIERIDHNVFGICDRCGDAIDIRRLEARPVTTMCIECKTLEEEEEKLREA